MFLPLANFFAAIESDGRIGWTHISLYFALLCKWNPDPRENPFPVSRDELMKKAKIRGRHTYNKCMNELHTYGYIMYEPSSDPAVRSRVCLLLL